MAQLSLAWIMSQKGIFPSTVVPLQLIDKISRRVGTHCWIGVS